MMIKIIRGWKRFRSIGLLLLGVSMSMLTILLAACNTGSTQAQTSAYHTNLKTSDGLFFVQFSVTPNRQGLNTFVVIPTMSSGGKPISTLQIHLDTTMLDMAMGTDILNLQVDKNGSYSGQSALTMAGNWQIRIELRSTDGTLHETTVKFTTTT